MSANAQLKSRRVGPAQTSKVNLLSLGLSKSKRLKGPSITQSEVLHEMPLPGSIRELDSPRPAASAMSQAPADSGGPLVASPASSTNFQGEFDQAKGGGPSGVFTTPPDTMGTVGLDKVVSYLNNNIVVHDKVSGAVLSVASIESFWASTGAIQVFDPRIQYDPYNNRWLIAAISNAQNANSSVLIGLSDSPDPQGTFSLYRFNVGCAAGSPGCNAQGEWADFPMLGFNKNWVTVAWNQFTINSGSFLEGQLLALDYPLLRGGVANSTLFSGVSAANAGFCMHPAATYSATENTLYLPSHQSSSEAAYRLHTITGTSDAPVFTVGALQTRPGGAWVQPGGDILPQHCVPAVGGAMHACPATIRRIDTADAFIRSNVVFRNGKIYYPQTIGLPLSGLTHTAVQWTVLSPDGTFFDGGRIEDPTATNSNGGKWYAFPSLSVNKNNDILFGFSEFESDDYADAGYTFRLGGDPPGTMRDPVIYKEGEDYYEKTFSGTRNRWGDYSHSVVDPVNDRDLWTVQEYAMLRQGTTGLGSNDSRWGTWWAKITAPAGPGDLLISEFRLRGPNGSTDEFVEILNPNSSPLTVQTIDGSAGYSLVASDGVSRFTIPNGTVIPARGHYLGVNSAGYSLSGYPAGNGTSATGDTTYTTDIPDNAGIALFNTSTAANFTIGNRLDAAGSTNEANILYREGSGYPALAIENRNYSFARTFCPNNFGVFGTALGCTPNGGAAAKDSNDNAADFLFIDTNFTSAGAGQRLGAPGPENLSVPIERTTLFAVQSLDATASSSSAPNRVRDLTSDPANNSTFGTLALRRRVVNGTGGPVTRLRFRIVDITIVPAPAGFADLRARTSALVSVSGVNDSMTCSPAPTPCTVNVHGTTMEEPPSQVNGGGFNTSLSAGTITLATPLAPGASANIQFLFGVQQTGSFRVFLIVEALP